MAVKLAYNKVEQFCDGSGIPYSGAKLFTYTAGSTTKQTTYTESTGTTPNTNPIVLDSAGRLPQPVWLTTGVNYKLVLAPSTDTDPPTSAIWTLDNVSGINDTTSAVNEWIAGPAPTFISAVSFSLVGDQTTTFHVGRRVKTTNTSGTSYGSITASAFGALTTVTVDTTGSNALDAGLSAISYGILAASNFTQSAGLDVVARQSADIASAVTLNLDAAGGDLVDVTGTTAITAITLARGKVRTVRFTGALTLTNGASLVLPGGASITTAAGDYAEFRGYAAGVVRCTLYTKATSGVLPAGFGMSPIANSLGADVNLNNVGTYFDGPSVAQGTAGTWLATGGVTVIDTAGAANFNVKLWDGTTVIASAAHNATAANTHKRIQLSGFITSPTGNIRISVNDASSTSGLIKFNVSGLSKDSTITAIRIA